MSDFEKLGIASALVEHLRSLGYRRASALQTDAVPVIARGTSAFGVASTGSGKTLAYALGIANRAEPRSHDLQFLILRPTDDRAAATAEALKRYLRPLELEVKIMRPGRQRSHTSAHIAVASPHAALAAVQASVIKFDELKALIVDGVSAMIALGAGEELETLVAQIPKDAQRVILSGQATPEVEDWLGRHARRARRLTDIPGEVEPLSKAAPADFCAAPRDQWLDVLVAALEGAEVKGSARQIVHCRVDAAAAKLSEMLAVRGFASSGENDSRLRIVCGDETDPAAASISWGVPLDLSSFRARVEGSASALFLVEPRELAHLRRLAAALDLPLAARPSPRESEAQRSTQLTRDLLRDAAASRDLEPYILLLEPLLQELTPVQIAAAATALLRERAPEEPAASLPAWTRLYVGLGRRDGIRPGDIVGAITGETAIDGGQIGRIEIRDTHSLVEIAAPLADQVIKSLAAATIRGKPAHVRVYRE